jgi:exodeoxyribonuclease VII small subunit
MDGRNNDYEKRGRQMTQSEAQGKSFESSLDALEQIVRELERGDLPLEKSLELFEQGIRLSRECQERLNQAERRIEVLMRDNQGRPMVAPFDDTTRETEEAV